MRAILALSRAQLLLIVVTRSRDLSRECHVTKHKTPAKSNFPMSNFENSGTIQFSSSRSTSRGLCPKNFEKGRTLNYTEEFISTEDAESLRDALEQETYSVVNGRQVASFGAKYQY